MALKPPGLRGSLRNVSTGFAPPDSEVFQNPTHQWWAGDGIGVDDGQTAETWEDHLASITAAAVNSPTFRSDQEGNPAVEYNGTDQAHDWPSDSANPTGNDSFSYAAMVYLNDTQADQTIISIGDTEPDEHTRLEITSGNVEVGNHGQDNLSANAPSAGSWITLGTAFDGDNQQLFINGSQEDSQSGISFDIADGFAGFAYRRASNDRYFDGYISEILVSGTSESSSAFSDFHNSRID